MPIEFMRFQHALRKGINFCKKKKFFNSRRFYKNWYTHLITYWYLHTSIIIVWTSKTIRAVTHIVENHYLYYK